MISDMRDVGFAKVNVPAVWMGIFMFLLSEDVVNAPALRA